MGSLFPPVLANIFMRFHECKWLNKYNLNKPKFCLRYVDGIQAPFRKEQYLLNLLNFLSNKYPNIKFTIEKQVNHCVAFLIILISGIDNKISPFKLITNRSIRDFS